MKLSTRTRYGSRAMAEIAVAYPDGTVSVSETAKNQHLSPKYLEHIMRALKVAGLIKLILGGMRGGYTLAREDLAKRMKRKERKT